eukprot:CAMPEP_0197938358 /NCGR_PEP_ID=MMETSP1439-20131203/118019_1 /TAXON_ID=66791 /ORGANISM="Gonyaulax spinifera, Strain CCMP409" /LENGTH=41 /DNA_ID= /DNA_START= /DNA_END= /DNA_ORIENTATION=
MQAEPCRFLQWQHTQKNMRLHMGPHASGCIQETGREGSKRA